MTDRLELAVTRDSWTSRLQLSISKLDEHGAGDGYRIAGPKFNGLPICRSLQPKH